MKRIFSVLLLAAVVLPSLVAAVEQEEAIGEEYITPLTYPKFSLGGSYLFNRRFHGFADPALRYGINSIYSTTLGMEVGLYRYMNAGGQFNVDMAEVKKGEPISMSLTLFAKPYISIGERISLFMRMGGGLSYGFNTVSNILDYLSQNYSLYSSDIQRVYKGQNYMSSLYGGQGMASVGIDVYPFSRVGISFEFGIRASLMRAHRNVPLLQNPSNVQEAPSALNVLLYEMPLALSINAIL